MGPRGLGSVWLGHMAPLIPSRIITKLRLGKSKDRDRVEGRIVVWNGGIKSFLRL